METSREVTVKTITAGHNRDIVMSRMLRAALARWVAAGLIAVGATAPVLVHAQAYLLPPFKECLARAEKGGKDAPTRSECYWRHQQAQSDNGP